ncbi:hypothetical protein HG531_011412 [Fusarium graminearum]|nr:hypothetical protein HG531_011412 [Fusarium graminearum]
MMLSSGYELPEISHGVILEVTSIETASGLTNAVHAELRVTEIQCSHTQGSSETRADGATTWRVVADDEKLKWNTSCASTLLNENNSWRVSGISLVGVDLDHSATVHGWLNKFKVYDIRNLNSCLGCNNIEDLRVVSFGNNLERLELLIFLTIILLLLGLLLDILVQLSSNKSCNREKLGLLVGVEVGLSVEVDSECWNPHQRLVDLDKLLNKVVAFLDKNTTSDAQVSIEPRGPDTTTICLDTDLEKADVSLLGNGLQSKAGRVGMSTNDGDRVTGTPLSADGESNDSGCIASYKMVAEEEGNSGENNDNTLKDNEGNLVLDQLAIVSLAELSNTVDASSEDEDDGSRETNKESSHAPAKSLSLTRSPDDDLEGKAGHGDIDTGGAAAFGRHGTTSGLKDEANDVEGNEDPDEELRLEAGELRREVVDGFGESDVDGSSVEDGSDPQKHTGHETPALPSNTEIEMHDTDERKENNKGDVGSERRSVTVKTPVDGASVEIARRVRAKGVLRVDGIVPLLRLRLILQAKLSKLPSLSHFSAATVAPRKSIGETIGTSKDRHAMGMRPEHKPP